MLSAQTTIATAPDIHTILPLTRIVSPLLISSVRRFEANASYRVAIRSSKSKTIAIDVKIAVVWAIIIESRKDMRCILAILISL